MKTLTYQGPASVRVLGDREFPNGVPVEVSDKDAQDILDGPHADEFTTTGQKQAAKED
ncbi:MAG: hypothetical protein KDB12_03720 [Ilumatobacter sp.]|nr:hypothetical protein [Ilumatobacter sp.]